MLLLVALTLLSDGCSGRKSETAQPSASSGAEPRRVMGLEELAVYDGAEGRSAYVAVRGVVYDVTDAPGWNDGVHEVWLPDRMAGRDLTEALSRAPPSHHRDQFWEALPVVGTLREN